ncbi:MAG: TIGR03905 family TSCPD domain-containing protein [Oscillospiraceae bacterium]|nr:TIGR03905 family TSCPD domain-containing protein [Oscillospiraceae bacterium]
MTYSYATTGTCAKNIALELDGNIIKAVEFTGGCNGNLQGISKLVEGMTAEEAMKRLRGIRCGSKPTSCPDQLAQALELALQKELQK